MSDPDQQTGGEGGVDEDLGQLLRTAGRRSEPPEAMADEVREAVHAEWLAVVAERRGTRRRKQLFAVAAVAAAAAIGLWMSRPMWASRGVAVASVARVVGGLEVDGGRFSAAQVLSEGQMIRVGDEVRTASAGGAALTLPSGIAVRLDADTRVKFVSIDRLSVSAGAAYVDTKLAGLHAAAPFVIATRLGAVRHLGTQYEVRLAGEQMQVTVREGKVELTGKNGAAQTGAAGERLTMHPGGRVERAAVSRDAPEWNWTHVLAAPFAIEDRPLADFLQWVGRELGREIVYATPQDEEEARQVILRGSTGALAPRESLAAVLSTTRLRSHEEGGRIVIERQ